MQHVIVLTYDHLEARLEQTYTETTNKTFNGTESGLYYKPSGCDHAEKVVCHFTDIGPEPEKAAACP
jgi:hypothetical protein